MDYLDPQKKKQKKIRLMIGYALLGVAISIATLVFVFIANGYYIDRETGVVIQNGLIYVDSKPESAKVSLNGESQRGETDSRLVIPEGGYDVELQRDGYIPWSRSLLLEGGTLRRLTYARLIPSVLTTELAVNVSAVPSDTMQSLDKRWVVLAFNERPFNMQIFDVAASVPVMLDIPLPLDIITPTDTGEWTLLEWADDHKTFLAEYRTGDLIQYVLVDRTNPGASVSLDTVFLAQPGATMSLRDSKNDLVYMHDESTGALYQGTVATGDVEVIAQGVIAYDSYGDNTVLYATKTGADAGFVRIVLQQDQTQYDIKQIVEDKSYLLELNRRGNAFVLGVASAAEGRVIVYNDPISAILDEQSSSIPVPAAVLKIDVPTELTISPDTSVIVARGGQQFLSHEFDEDRTYEFEIGSPVEDIDSIAWADGQHFIVTQDDGGQMIVDFDGSNQNKLAPSQIATGSFLNGSSDEQFTFLGPLTEDAPARLMRTYLRSVADR